VQIPASGTTTESDQISGKDDDMRPALRLFSGDVSGTSIADSPAPAMTVVRFGEILEPLADALRQHRAFLEDFADDEVQITTDLYDVLMACRRLRAGA